MEKFPNWQRFLDTTVESYEEQSKVHTFKNIDNDLQRIEFVFKHDIIGECVDISRYFTQRNTNVHSRKNAAQAEVLRKTGNSHFLKKKNKDALQCYNQCICHAPASSAELPMGLANRSAVFMHMKKYAECVDDIQAALAAGYDQSNAYKLLLRKAKALLALAKVEEAKEVLTRLLESFESMSSLDDTKREKIKSDAHKLLDECAQSNPSSRKEPLSKVLPSVLYGSNTVVTQATSAISLECSEKQGRHLVTKKPLKAGDVLIVEEPFAAVLLPPHYSSHCHHCYAKLLQAFPCSQCSTVMFCSQQCRTDATYHSVECVYMDLLHSIGIAHLSLRIVLTAGLPCLLEFDKDRVRLESIPGRLAGVTADGKYSKNYLSVYDLMPHSDDLDVHDLFQYTLTASLLLQLLQNTQFFPAESECSTEGAGVLPAQEAYIGSLLLRHICQLVCNAHAITDVQVSANLSGSLVDETQQVRIATAIYPSVSLMNHACEPSIIASFDRNILVVRAVKDMKKGEQIYNCYGPHCKRMPYLERQQSLKEQYFFTCECSACSQEGRQEKRYQALSCPSCSGPLPVEKEDRSCCLDCEKMYSTAEQLATVVRAEQDFITGLKHLQREDAIGALGYFKSCLRQREKVLYQHNKQLAECQDAVARCHAVLGQFDDAVTLLDKSIQTTEVIYGDTSIELANELQKLSEILYHAKQWKRLKDVSSRGKTLFSMHYGPEHESVVEMTELEAIVKKMRL